MTELELARELGLIKKRSSRYFNNITILNPRLVEHILSLKAERDNHKCEVFYILEDTPLPSVEPETIWKDSIDNIEVDTEENSIESPGEKITAMADDDIELKEENKKIIDFDDCRVAILERRAVAKAKHKARMKQLNLNRPKAG